MFWGPAHNRPFHHESSHDQEFCTSKYTRPGALIAHFKSRRILGLNFTPVVNAGRRYVGMPEPFLDLGDVRIVVVVWNR